MLLQLGTEYINGNFINYLDSDSGSEEERDMVKIRNNEFSHHIFIFCSKEQIKNRIEKGCKIQTTLHMLF